MQTASLAGPGGLTGLTGPQPYVSPSLRAFQIAVLLQIAQSQFVSVESHSSVFFRLLYVVNMVSKTCFFNQRRQIKRSRKGWGAALNLKCGPFVTLILILWVDLKNRPGFSDSECVLHCMCSNRSIAEERGL